VNGGDRIGAVAARYVIKDFTSQSVNRQPTNDESLVINH
jgi:hypothetical protein